jgi:hypothetical protein
MVVGTILLAILKKIESNALGTPQASCPLDGDGVNPRFLPLIRIHGEMR